MDDTNAPTPTPAVAIPVSLSSRVSESVGSSPVVAVSFESEAEEASVVGGHNVDQPPTPEDSSDHEPASQQPSPRHMHPAIVAHAEEVRQRRESGDASSTARVRDSFRHSFAMVEHPTNQGLGTTPPSTTAHAPHAHRHSTIIASPIEDVSEGVVGSSGSSGVGPRVPLSPIREPESSTPPSSSDHQPPQRSSSEGPPSTTTLTYAEALAIAIASASAEPSTSPSASVAAAIPMPASPQPTVTAAAPAQTTELPPSAGTNQPPPGTLPPTTISMSRLTKLLHYFIFMYSKNSGTHRASSKSLTIQHRVTSLARIDYHVSVIINDSTRNGANRDAANAAHARNGGGVGGGASGERDVGFEYCSSYPLDLIIFENEKTGPYGVGDADESDPNGSSSHTLQSRVNDSAVLKPLFRLSRFSRVHGRFVIPVILVRNKNICRSSTLAIQAEAIFNNIHSATKQMIGSFWDTLSGLGGGGGGSGTNATNGTGGTGTTPSTPTSQQQQQSVVQVGLEGQRAHDIQLLLHTATSYVEDLMVEHRKKKLGVALTSSEKNEQWRYAQMKLNALPYPGCEFFTEYKSNHHSGTNLFFNWNQSFISSDLLLSNPPPMIPDEMLSCNGRTTAAAAGQALAHAHAHAHTGRDADQAPWFEFQHDVRHHRAEHARHQREIDLAAAAAAAADAASATSPPAPYSPPTSSTSPPICSVADDILDQLLSHSASAGDTTPMATTSPMEDSTTIGVTSSTSGTTVPATAAASVHAAAVAAVASPAVPASRPIASDLLEPSSSFGGGGRSRSSSSSHGDLEMTSTNNSGGSGGDASAASHHKDVTSFALYKSWDLVTLTKNYMLILLAHIADEAPNSGVLVHCISGWDRTPLFISLLRLSLWADGEAHRGLSAIQILYFTIAYDWMSFGHHLHNRIEKGEDVFYFCFDFLQYLTHTKFSLQTAVAMRQHKRVVEEELHIERSSTPTIANAVAAALSQPTPPSPMPDPVQPVPEKPRTSALTSALKQAKAGGAAGHGASAAAVQNAPSNGTVSDDEEPTPLFVGPSSFSPATSSLHALPPVSSSYTASKPMPSLASFIIESHSREQQRHHGETNGQHRRNDTDADVTQSPSADSDQASTTPLPTTSPGELPAYMPPTSAIPIPTRKMSKGLLHPPSSSGSAADASTSTTPVAVGRSLQGNVVDPIAMQAAALGHSGTSVDSHFGRVNSWTLIAAGSAQTNAGLTTPSTASALPTLHTVASSPLTSTPPVHAHLHVPDGKAKSSSQSGSAHSPASSWTSSSSRSFSPLSDSDATAASLRRCERLLEVRALFMTAYHSVLPTAPTAAPSPHTAHTAAHLAGLKAAAARRRASVSAQHETNGSKTNAASTTVTSPPPSHAATAPSLPSSLPAPVAAPIAAPIAAPVRPSSNGWFSS